MPKKTVTVDSVVETVKVLIDQETAPLGDHDYLQALEEIQAYLQSCVEAKEEELEEEDDDDEDDEDDEEDDEED